MTCQEYFENEWADVLNEKKIRFLQVYTACESYLKMTGNNFTIYSMPIQYHLLQSQSFTRVK